MIPSRWHVVALLAAAWVATAQAAPPIAGGDLPGRERERFVELPVGRAFQQQPLGLPDWHVAPDPRCHRGALRHPGSRRPVRCQPSR
jgi:hypothetical protein